MTFNFPNWPINRVLAEAVATHNILHPDEQCDVGSSNWERLCAIIHRYLRHQLTGYDELLAAGQDREELHQAIATQAATFYPWLRINKDPREKLVARQKEPLLFTHFSEELCRLRDRRGQLLVARRKRSREERCAIDEEVRKLDARIATLDTAFKHAFEVPPEDHFRTLIWSHRSGQYLFADRCLPSNYIRPSGFKCPNCLKAVWQTKRPITFGSGVWLVAFSCECLAVSVASAYLAETDAAFWERVIEAETHRKQTLTT